MPKLNLQAIKDVLFRNEAARNRLCKDFGLEVDEDAESMSQSLLRALNQPVVPEPLSQVMSNRSVYRAAVHALGSNSRAWSSFVRNRESIEQVLNHYDLSKRADASQLVPLLPGQSGSADARAIVAWRQILLNERDYYSRLATLGEALRKLDVAESELLPCVAAFIGAPPAASRMHPALAGLYQIKPRPSWKAPGMGAVLASEFLRNMGWSGFKPDRHVARLLSHWVPEVLAEQRVRGAELAGLLGTRSQLIVQFMTYSLAGVRVTPPGMSFSVADNLVWALGAYVERKNSLSGRCYVESS